MSSCVADIHEHEPFADRLEGILDFDPAARELASSISRRTKSMARNSRISEALKVISFSGSDLARRLRHVGALDRIDLHDQHVLGAGGS